MKGSTMKCPNCDRNYALANAVPHCRNKACTWMRCPCGHTSDRNSNNSFKTETN